MTMTPPTHPRARLVWDLTGESEMTAPSRARPQDFWGVRRGEGQDTNIFFAWYYFEGAGQWRPVCGDDKKPMRFGGMDEAKRRCERLEEQEWKKVFR